MPCLYLNTFYYNMRHHCTTVLPFLLSNGSCMHSFRLRQTQPLPPFLPLLLSNGSCVHSFRLRQKQPLPPNWVSWSNSWQLHKLQTPPSPREWNALDLFACCYQNWVGSVFEAWNPFMRSGRSLVCSLRMMLFPGRFGSTEYVKVLHSQGCIWAERGSWDAGHCGGAAAGCDPNSPWRSWRCEDWVAWCRGRGCRPWSKQPLEELALWKLSSMM